MSGLTHHKAAQGGISRKGSKPAHVAAKSGGGSNILKYIDLKQHKARRLAALATKSTAAKLLQKHDEKRAKNVSFCGYVAYTSSVELGRNVHQGGAVSGSLKGLKTCNSVWVCPCCSPRISAVRRDELNHALVWARAEGHAVVMLTLTARHSRRTDLTEFLGGLKDALVKMRQSKGWRALPVVGSVVATEVTHGEKNGWHPHFHLLLFLRAAPNDALAAVEGLRAEWSRSLGKVGRTGNEHAFHVQGASEAGEYIGKFGAAEELVLGHTKQGRCGSRTPWQLLADARDGDKVAAALWIKFAMVFKGRRQLVWSNGFKKMIGLDELSDDEAGAAEYEKLRAWGGSSDEWRAARRRRAALLDAAEDGSSLDAAEFGPTDAQRWRDEQAASSVVDDGDSGVSPVSPSAPAAVPARRPAGAVAAAPRAALGASAPVAFVPEIRGFGPRPSGGFLNPD